MNITCICFVSDLCMNKYCSKDGWMTCNFTSFSTVFPSYQDEGHMIMEAVCSATTFMVEKIPPKAEIEPGQLDQ